MEREDEFTGFTELSRDVINPSEASSIVNVNVETFSDDP